MSWTNSDGLLVRFDHEKIVRTTGGEFPGAGSLREVVFKVDVADLTTTPTLIEGEGIIFPRNSRVEEVEVVAETAAATITSVSFGLKRLDRSTELDHDGLVAALVVASINAAGEKNTLTPGSTSAGALIGTTLAYPGLPVAYIAGSTGTGVLVVRAKLYVPGEDANPTNY
jgi:hypothetical protein